MKKIMMLGGNYFQATATKAARDLGNYVISVDYLPDNPGHQYANAYYNVSTTDRESVYKFAEELKIDGIVSYASDVSAPTAAYVANKMGLVGNPLSSVEILTQKDLFRQFLKENGFRVPAFDRFTNKEESEKFLRSLGRPVIVKPVDSSGSKGVSKVSDPGELGKAFDLAMSYSLSKRVILEEFISKEGYQIDGDGFLLDGKLAFTGFVVPHFDSRSNYFAQVGERYPTYLDEERRKIAEKEIQRALSLLNMKTGALNLEFMFDTSGNFYLLEIGPRNGGNLISDIIKEATGIDLAKATILDALGEDCTGCFKQTRDEMVSSYIIHSTQKGKLKGVDISPDLEKDLLLYDLWIKPGDAVLPYDNGSLGIGVMLIRHHSKEEMLDRMDHMEKYMHVDVENT